jgi:diacylglycerol kinase family enzyme
VLNSVLRPAEIKWDVFVTIEAGDAIKYTRQAVAAGVDAVAVYGGDGTVAETASGLIGSHMPLAILPGGTANSMATELVIPGALEAAAALVCDAAQGSRLVDLDEEKVVMDGLDCMVTNQGSIGALGATIAGNVSVSDGLLGILLIRKDDLASLGELVGSMTGLTDPANLLPHWQARNARIEADPPHKVTADGEVLGSTPVDIRVLPSAVRVVVPPSAFW